MNLWLIFLTGLTTGGLSCLAVQGGLVVSLLANSGIRKPRTQENDSKSTNSVSGRSLLSLQAILILGVFLVAKLIAHILLGYLLGMLGSKITLSLEIRLIVQGLTALFLFATAMNLLQVHLIFRYVSLQPPASLSRYIRRLVKKKAGQDADDSTASYLFTAAVLGVLTIFIPCGVTQAMEVQAINTASPIQGALLMGAFVLGTMPLFAGIGLATSSMTEKMNVLFSKVAAAALIGMALYSANGILEVMGSPFAFSAITNSVDSSRKPSQKIETTNNVQKIQLNVTNRGYSPSRITVKKGVPVELTLKADKVYSCAADFVIPSLKVRKFLNPTDSYTVRFTPDESGRIPFSCSMGMYNGVIEVK